MGPGLASCARAREDLRIVRASPAWTFFVLVEGHGRSAVTVFRNPKEAKIAPMAGLDFCELLEQAALTGRGAHGAGASEEILGVAVLEVALVVTTRDCALWCQLDASVQVREVALPLAALERMPLGIDPKAVLRMLDMGDY